jgi:hypothetical protein
MDVITAILLPGLKIGPAGKLFGKFRLPLPAGRR